MYFENAATVAEECSLPRIEDSPPITVSVEHACDRAGYFLIAAQGTKLTYLWIDYEQFAELKPEDMKRLIRRTIGQLEHVPVPESKQFVADYAIRQRVMGFRMAVGALPRRFQQAIYNECPSAYPLDDPMIMDRLVQAMERVSKRFSENIRSLGLTIEEVQEL